MITNPTQACPRICSQGNEAHTATKKWGDHTALKTNNLPHKDLQFAISVAWGMDVTLKSSFESKHAAQQK